MPLECGIIFDGIPEGAISRKVCLIWGIPAKSYGYQHGASQGFQRSVLLSSSGGIRPLNRRHGQTGPGHDGIHTGSVARREDRFRSHLAWSN